MKRQTLTELGDPKLIARGYNLGLKIASNVTSSFTREMLEYFEKNPHMIKSALEKGFVFENIITFDSALFNPAKEKFLGKGWRIDEPEDSNYLALTGFNPSEIVLDHAIKDGENCINGEERLTRLKAKTDFIRLGAKAFFAFKRNPHLLPEDWKKRNGNGNIRFIHFDGTILRYPYGDRLSLYLFWNDGEWIWNTDWLDDVWNRDSLSALVPASSSVRA